MDKLRAALLFSSLALGTIAASDTQPYIVGPHDSLVIMVFNQPQLSGKYVVETDGSFTFPLLGRVKVGGLSLQRIEAELRERLAQGYLKDPQVTVAVDSYRSQQVFVIGEVRQPGPLALVGPMTLLEALARAGSTTERAGEEAVIVHAGSDGSSLAPDATSRLTQGQDSTATRIDLRQLQTGLLAENVTLRAGDTVFVPRAQTIFIMGQVKSPGEYPLRKAMTVRQALALAAGVTDRGSMRRIQIIRMDQGAEIKINAELGDPVRPGDTIFVRERLF